MTTLDAKIALLGRQLADLDRVVVCFSGGVDSGYLLAEAVGVLGDRAVALTAISPSLAPEEGAAARHLAEQLGARHLLVDTAEVDDPRYAANPVNRCYFCKVEVYGRAVREAARLGGHHVVDGFNRDDRGDHRPGRQAAKENGVRSPLDEAGFTKADIREAARRLGLPVWNKPALACLSSRFPYGRRHHAGTADAGGRVRARAPRARIQGLPGPALRRASPHRGRPRGSATPLRRCASGRGHRPLPGGGLRTGRGRSQGVPGRERLNERAGTDLRSPS